MKHKECEVNNCIKKVVSNGLCDTHRKRLERHGHIRQTRQKDWGKRKTHPLYHTWSWMRKMRNKYNIDETWDDFWVFVNDVGERPTPQHQLHRLRKWEGFGPCNFKWYETIQNLDRAEYAKQWRKDNPHLAKNNGLRRDHGITFEDYKKLEDSQNGVCAICGGKQIERYEFFSVDHCHETGKIRGLLCSKCNIGLGHFEDSVEKLQSAINYLNN